MAGIVLNYSSENSNISNGVSEQLECFGCSAWWDRDIGAGQSWRKAFEQSLATTRVMGVKPIDGESIQVAEGRSTRKPMLVRIEEVKPPIAFSVVPATEPLMICDPTFAPLPGANSLILATASALNDPWIFAPETSLAATGDASRFKLPPKPLIGDINNQCNEVLSRAQLGEPPLDQNREALREESRS